MSKARPRVGGLVLGKAVGGQPTGVFFTDCTRM